MQNLDLVTPQQESPPMKKNTVRRTLAMVAASAMAVGASVMGAATASAALGKYVAFGDSFPANPGMTDAANGWERIGAGGCPQSAQNVGHHVAWQTGLELHDWSCNGTVSYMPNTPERTLLTQIDNASASGHLQGARLVTFFLGANDAMQSFWAPSEMQDQMYVDNVRAAIDRVKAESPQAQVMIVGYPEFISADPSHVACPINVGGVAPRIGAAPVKVYEDSLQHRQWRAASESGATFLNMKERVNVNVGMCGDENRLVSAFIDDNVGEYNMTNHLTHAGSIEFARAIVDQSGMRFRD